MTIQLAVDNLQLWRGEAHLLRGLAFTVGAGQCLQVRGRNGVGKTTLLRALCGLSLLEEGTIHWCGKDVAADRYAFHADLAYQGHDVALKGDLTAVENLRYGVGLRRTVALAEIHSALRLAGLANIDFPVRQLSAGQRRRVALARVELLGVRLWLLDEPTSNLDADGHALVSLMLNQHLAGGGVALIATHQDLGIEPARLLTLELN